MRCASGTECQNLERNCTTPPCETYGACVNTTVVDNLAGGCDTMRCEAGETCQEAMVNVQRLHGKKLKFEKKNIQKKNFSPRHAMCVLDMTQNDTLNSCASVTCPVGESCEETTVQCFVAPCTPYISCVPKSSGCGTVTCPDGEKCVERNLDCLIAPCPKAVSCVPMNANQNSTARQGCDVIRCRSNEICEETEVQCLMAPCPIQVACVSIIHTNGTTNSTSPGNSPSVCPRNQTMSDCLNKCSEEKCPGIGISMMCTKHCGQGCACAAGFVRSSDGECYKSKDCPLEQVCGDNEEYRCEKCAGTCKNPEPNCPGPHNKKCNKKCICAAGFVKKNGKCVTLASCPDHDHNEITCLGTEEYTDCLPKCRQLCSGVTECDKNMHTEMCTPGCVCRPSYKLDSNGTCVHNRHCFKTTDCPVNEEWSKCISDDNICGMATIQKVPLRDQCFSGCICAAGFARNSNGTCVEHDKC
ncbi:Protein CBG20701 [Caenorhabditis briggsae]|uniref:Protein CBG20701 n=1 Tax=Caenorhabditis briggsae TaxID=6238 RepID=A8XYE9_CAEBR|nr:Protein CBG20701 [Caenorhabditis briggsae]CAP37666.2 Protein CBG20701 [Caenorhabditis briggsae]